ncbi:SOS response-associated peptidase family protein [Pantoea sp. EA-12]|uniref:SOS response-associated peptidase family protein n=1 Tax=Pantoea sp. EA-12 TaxID=3043303 RepID=UPI0032D5866C
MSWKLSRTVLRGGVGGNFGTLLDARDREKKQPYYIYHKNHEPLFFAAIGKAPYDDPHGHEGFLIVTAPSNKGMVDIHDRRPLVLEAGAIKEWLSADTSAKRAEEIANKEAVPENDFKWHPVSSKVGSPKNQSKELLEKI